jgi:hypothetical protein
MKRQILLFSFMLFAGCLLGQAVAIGGWKEHLSYKNAVSVAEGNGKVYCATKSGIFILNKGDNSLERISKVSGLSDVEAVVLNFNKHNNKLIIAYQNSNIDIVESNNAIINISDIKRKSIIGNKSINGIYILNQYAYLSCGFGIVVLDMDRNEVKDTYYIGTLGAAVNVRDITSDGTYFYAATDQGVFRALQNNPNLANYASWTKFSTTSGLPTGIYNTITAFNGNIYVNRSKYIMNNVMFQDSVYYYNGTSWLNFSDTSAFTVYQLRTFNNKLMIVRRSYIDFYNTAGVNVERIFQYVGAGVDTKSAVQDNNNQIWVADNWNGLVHVHDNYNSWNYYLNGPATPNVRNLVANGEDIWIAPGSVDDAWSNLYLTEGVSRYSNGTWSRIGGNYPGIVNTDTLFDLLYIAVDPSNPERAFVSSWWDGLLEVHNNVPVKLYNDNDNNSTLHNFTGTNVCKIAGLAFDQANNLWVCNPFNPNSMSVRHGDGSWEDINLSAVIGNSPYMGQMIIDKNDQKWVVLTRGGGLMVYKGGTTADAVAGPAGNAKKLTTAAGNGKLPSTGVYCIAEDKDGEIWVGTDKGIAVFYSPESVFNGGNFDAQQILLEQDGNIQILLETEVIQSIAVDDANNKWIATLNSGVFLMSADGTRQIHHFDVNSSPLFSNDVRSIAINRVTGEVYFGTSKGVLSYRGTAIEGNESFTDVYAFPNPVTHDYSGPIAIKGLVDNTTLKITDISGSFVYETKSEGGQAIWDGKNFNGERVSSGVYMVFCTNEDGSQKVVTKILLIN